MAEITNYFDNEGIVQRAEEYINSRNTVFSKKEPLTFIQFLHNINNKDFSWEGVCRFCARYNPNGGNSCSINWSNCEEEILWHIIKGERVPSGETELKEIIDKIRRDAAEKAEERRREMEAEDIWMEFQQDTADNPVNVSSDPMVENPTHYTSGTIECIDAIASATKDLNGIEAFDTGNAIKYLWRWRKKNGKQDLEKARWYVNHLIAHLEKAEEDENE